MAQKYLHIMAAWFGKGSSRTHCMEHDAGR